MLQPFLEVRMTYQFKCHNCRIEFEVEQPIHYEHQADCPLCGGPGQRIYTPLNHFWIGQAHNPDGSVQEDLPQVGGGPPTKWTHGFGPGKKGGRNEPATTPD